MGFPWHGEQPMARDATEIWQPTPRRRVFLMRHGEVDYFDAAGRPFRPETVPLNAAGREQARAAGEALRATPIDLALTSGLNRTEETARLVLAGRDVPLAAEPRLREIETGRMSDWAGASAAQVQRAVLGALDGLSPQSRFLGGETFAALGERVLACWRELLARPDWRALLVVAHGVVNRFLLCHALGAPLAALSGLEQDAACINLLEVDGDGRCLVRLLNFTPLAPTKNGLAHSTLEGLYAQYLRGRG
jgi:probable phosphoglycerate mutase